MMQNRRVSKPEFLIDDESEVVEIEPMKEYFKPKI